MFEASDLDIYFYEIKEETSNKDLLELLRLGVKKLDTHGSCWNHFSYFDLSIESVMSKKGKINTEQILPIMYYVDIN